MRRFWKKYFIPHKGNDYKPHALRELTVTVVTIAVALSLFLPQIYGQIANKIEFLATLLPGVLVDLSNDNRQARQEPPLKINSFLTEAAQLKADDMAQKEYFAHVSPEGLTPWYWFEKVGYSFSSAGENLAVNFTEPEEVLSAWMNSSAHRENILNSNFKEIGVATAQGTYQGRETIFVVQMFGTPAPAPAAVSRGRPIAQASALDSSQERKEMFIQISQPGPAEVATAVDTSEERSFYVSPIERLAVSPRTTLNYGYLVLIFLVAITLILNVTIEIKKQHPRHIAYGIGLLLILAVAIFINQSAVFSKVIIG